MAVFRRRRTTPAFQLVRSAGRLRRHGARWMWVLVAVSMFHGSAAAAAPSGPKKLLRRLLAPFRANPFLQTSDRPCGLGFAECFLPSEAGPPPVSKFEPLPDIEDPERRVTMELRTRHRGPFCHHWIELESSRGKVTIGYGPATVPFIDAGQIALQDEYGNTERISGMHPLPVLGLPPLNYSYAKAPGSGRRVGKPYELTVAQADALIQKERHHKFVVPYIPFFHDCRTFVCSVQATAEGRSSLPCYLLFKGYW